MHPRTDRARRDCTHPNVTHEHGSAQAYNQDRCRCAPCTDAIRAHQLRYRRRVAAARWSGRAATIDGTGTRRRLQGLAVLGWTRCELAARLGVSGQAVHEMCNREGKVFASSAERIAALYEQLSMTPRSESWVNGRASRYALRRGWHPPLAWDDIDDPAECPARDGRAPAFCRNCLAGVTDDVLVLRLVAGHASLGTNSRAPEVLAAIRVLAARELSDPEIGERLGLSRHAVHKQRLRAGIASRWVAAS